jgi:DNA modification methylase
MVTAWQSDCGTARLWCGDALEVMREFESNSVDVVVTDPP